MAARRRERAPGRAQQHDREQQVAPVDAVRQEADDERGRRAHAKECRRDVAAQVPAARAAPRLRPRAGLARCPRPVLCERFARRRIGQCTRASRRSSHTNASGRGPGRSVAGSQRRSRASRPGAGRRRRAARLSRCSSLKWNSRAMAVRLGAIRFWSAYSSAAVSVKMATMYTRCTSGMGCAASAGPGGQGFLPSDSRTRVGRRPHAVQAAA